MGIAGISALTGCSAGTAEQTGGEVVGSQLAALTSLVTASSLQRGTRHDYNGDGKEDIIFYNSSGSYLYLGAAPNGWTGDAWVRHDLTPTNTSYAAGDFNGDGKTDLIITTAGGSYEYTGRSDGGFNPDVWVSNTLTFGNVAFTVGDFNGDGKTDFIATTSTGSYLYTGKGGATGGFNANVWANTALKMGDAKFTPGNFDSDATTDFIVSLQTGSREYTGKTGAGGFNANVWTNATLNTGTLALFFTVGNFNGAGPDDFIVQKEDGAFLYTGKATGGFNSNVWSDPEYAVTGSGILAGNFDGIGGADIIVQNGTAALERVWIGNSFSSSLWGDSRYGNFYDAFLRRGDFNGDGMDDLLSATRDNSPLPDGTNEHTGRLNGGFDATVWTRSDLFMGDIVIF